MSSDPLDQDWDVIVVGTGIGGGTIGRRLAEQGMSVLFVEKGPASVGAEHQYLRTDLEDPHARQIRGYWPKPIMATLDGQEFRFFGPIGSGVGGTSSFYAATLERPEPHDIDDSPERPHPTGGWPVAYADFLPYFRNAERLYEVCGERDPLSPEPDPGLRSPPQLPLDDRVMKESFERNGLNPYHVHMAVRFLPGCQQCFGRKCPRQCKMDASLAGVQPALATGRATVLDNCEVTAIRSTRSTVTHLEASRNGNSITLKARFYVVAAGALGSPKLFLVSRDEHWPNGLANDNDLVGRNLMFHLTEMVAIWPPKGTRSIGPSKALAFRDFYFWAGRRFGALQAIGVDASYGMIVQYINTMFDLSPFRRMRTLRQFTRIPAFIAARVFGSAKIFAGIIEDLPYPSNRVLVDPDDPERIRFTYDYPAEMHERRRLYRRILRGAFFGHRTVFLSPRPDLNMAHCCGTLRFGDDPRTSVLDRDCKAHGLSNLFVADASFMPTSLGINPSLTIAANALRVAAHILERARNQRMMEHA
jgi:choline dehydrogenase-like flavoprotein